MSRSAAAAPAKGRTFAPVSARPERASDRDAGVSPGTTAAGVVLPLVGSTEVVGDPEGPGALVGLAQAVVAGG